MLEGVQEKLTIWWIDNFLGGYRGKEDFRGEEVYLFSSKTPYSGMALASREIAINERLFREGSKEALDAVYFHEKQHMNDHILSVLTGTAQTFVLSPLSLALNFVFLSIASILSLLEFYPGFLEAEILLKLVSADLLISFSAIVVSQVGEVRAELNAFKRLGPEQAREAKEELRDTVSKPGYLTSLSIRLTHPTPEIVERIYSLMNN